ncbi:MAG: universal stress protein [Xanthobacteraceae bacterium]|nr:universal stress protein [Xanthobacteraceae bacterium]
MTYATVMANLKLYDSNDACLAVAGDVAERFEAHVIGVAASEFSPPPYFTAGVAAQRLLDEANTSIEKRMSELEEQFRAAIAPRAKSVEWRSALTLPIDYVARQARAADIVVTGQGGPELSDPFRQADADDLVMRAGRPLLIAPQTTQWLDVRSCLIAWKDGPEARRAVADALPLLRKAKDVTIVEVLEQEGGRSGALARVHDVAAWLARHGISATGVIPEQVGHATEQIERVAATTGAGVVIAGAYGHSRLREWVLGGVTRQLLGNPGRCALLAR